MRRLAEARPAHLDDGGPDAGTRARELGRVFAQPSGVPEVPLVQSSGPPLAPAVLARRHRVRMSVALGTGVAGVMAVALAVAVVGHDPRRPQRPQSTPTVKSALLTAADRAEQAPIGRVWYVDRVFSSVFLTKAGYGVTGAGGEDFSVTEVKDNGLTTQDARDLPSWPVTAADRAAWRAAGSPPGFHVWANDHYDDFSTTKAFMTTGAWAREMSKKNSPFSVSPVTGLPTPDKSMTVAQLQKLPSDPARLTTIFFPPMKPLPPLTVDNVYTTDWSRSTHMIQEVGMICAYPLPPKVRAGLMRALAAQPGVQEYGTVTDAFGRTGIAVGVEEPDRRVWHKAGKNAKPINGEPGAPDRPGKVGWEKAPYGSRDQLIFDPKTGEYLGNETVLTRPGGEYAKQKPGFVIYFDLVRKSGWTDHRPSRPHALPPK